MRLSFPKCSEILRSLVLSYSAFDRSTPIHVLLAIFHTPYSVLSGLIYHDQSLLDHCPCSMWSARWWEKVIVSFLLDFSHEIISHYNSKSSCVWNLSSLEHFYLQNHYLSIFETSTTSLCLPCYSAFGTFSCLMLQRKLGKSRNI